MTRLRERLSGPVLLRAGIAAGLTAALVTTGVSAPATAASHHRHTKVATTKTSLGRVLANHKGRVMFLFKKDHIAKSHCSASCQSIWPPVTSTAKPHAGAHLKRHQLGRTSDGQVTYYGHPLYYYIGDPRPGKTKGDGISEFGAKWYVVSTHGKRVKPKPTKPTKPTGPTGPAEVTTHTVGKKEQITSADGHTLYELSSDSPPHFACTGSCATAWPPLLTKGAPTVAGDADASLLGTVTRPDGTTQVTYNGYALYDYSGDKKPGQDNGQYVYEPGGSIAYWYGIYPSGDTNPAFGP